MLQQRTLWNVHHSLHWKWSPDSAVHGTFSHLSSKWVFPANQLQLTHKNRWSWKTRWSTLQFNRLIGLSGVGGNKNKKMTFSCGQIHNFKFTLIQFLLDVKIWGLCSQNITTPLDCDSTHWWRCSDDDKSNAIRIVISASSSPFPFCLEPNPSHEERFRS